MTRTWKSEVEEGEELEARGQHTGPAAAARFSAGVAKEEEPDTGTDWQRKRLDEDLDEHLDMDGDKLPVQSLSPTQEADPDHRRLLSEVARMKRMESEEMVKNVSC